MPPFNRLVILPPLLDGVIGHARRELPNECCGLLGGLISDGVGYAFERYALRNDLASPTEYASNPQDMLAAVRAMRKMPVEILAVYHSHPASAPVPSRKDLERNYWGDTVVHIIIGLAGDEPDVRVWWLTETDYRPAEWSVSS